jgi:inorganic pyrophosphatase
MILHPWHEIPLGDKAPDICWAFIEISRGSRAKYEIEKDSGLLKLDRVLHSAVYYPVNYGFFPQTMQVDGDPLDVLVLSQIDITPHCLVQVKIIGVMRMIDQGITDDKVIAVAINDTSVNYIQDVSELPPHIEPEFMHFFETYTFLEHKKVTTKKFESRAEGMKVLVEGIRYYKEKRLG